jgi:ribosomal protein S18 acetylase RimI-like enzyme
MTDAGQIWMLAIHAKTRRENLPAHVIRLIKDKMVKS